MDKYYVVTRKQLKAEIARLTGIIQKHGICFKCGERPGIMTVHHECEKPAPRPENCTCNTNKDCICPIHETYKFLASKAALSSEPARKVLDEQLKK